MIDVNLIVIVDELCGVHVIFWISAQRYFKIPHFFSSEGTILIISF